MNLELSSIGGGNTSVSALNNNFQKIEDWVNINALWRQGDSPPNANQMETNLDMNGFSILNAATDPTNPDSMITIEGGDQRYVLKSGDEMLGSLNMGAYPLLVRQPFSINEPVRLQDLQSEADKLNQDDLDIRQDFASADASLQQQIVEGAPLMAAERPVISWHPQTLTNSVSIPDNMNAQSTGPVISLANGVVVTIGDNSSWIIVNGEVQ